MSQVLSILEMDMTQSLDYNTKLSRLLMVNFIFIFSFHFILFLFLFFVYFFYF